MPFFISRDDITTLKTDAIVNAGNRELRMGGGVCGAIFKAAGAEEMERALQGLGPISIGDAVATPGFALPARYVIHTAGPIYHGRKEERDLLASCYRNSLLLAEKMHLSSVAFPLISSGIYGYPVEEAEQVALDAILSFLETHDMTVYLIILKERLERPWSTAGCPISCNPMRIWSRHSEFLSLPKRRPLNGTPYALTSLQMKHRHRGLAAGKKGPAKHRSMTCPSLRPVPFPMNFFAPKSLFPMPFSA